MNVVDSSSELKKLQQRMASALLRPLTSRWKMRKYSEVGDSMEKWAAEFIKPNDQLSSFERLEIYNRCYWFRLLDCFYDDYPGLLAILGRRKFLKLATAYLERYPSESFALRNLGSHLEKFLLEEPQWTVPHEEMALDMARFEWAQVVAFDGPAETPLAANEILNATPDRLRLQPYLSLLELQYTVDHFLLAVKKRENEILRAATSNTVNSTPQGDSRRRRICLPKRESLFLAIHRYENRIYYKRLELGEFVLLTALRRGESLDAACQAAVEREEREPKDWPIVIHNWFANWSSLGWLVSPKTTNFNRHGP